MDVECLDLCLSCGSHVADGTPYCSTRCRSADSSSKMSSSSSRHHQYPSSVYYNQPYASSSSASSRRPRLDLGDYYHQTHHEEHLIQHSKKLASIQEWAKGVWGDAGDAATATSKPRRSSHSHHTSFPSSATKAKSPSPSARYNAPRFTLTAQHLAPPAMSIAHSSSDDDNSSIHTPSTCSISPPTHSHAPKRFSSEGSVDPWISSPPYEFAYNHFFPTKKGEQQPERGRTLLRV